MYVKNTAGDQRRIDDFCITPQQPKYVKALNTASNKARHTFTQMIGASDQSTRFVGRR